MIRICTAQLLKQATITQKSQPNQESKGLLSALQAKNYAVIPA